MRKNGYCSKCNNHFVYEINSVKDLNSVICPKCGNRALPNYRRPIIVTKKEKKWDFIFKFIFNFYYYFYLLFSILGLIAYFLNFDKLLLVSTIILCFIYIIELLLGLDRNIFGFFGLLFSILVFSFILGGNGFYLGVIVCFFISSIIKLIFNLFIKFLYRKYG